MTCEECLNLVDDLVEGDLAEQNVRQVNLHNFTCRDCAYQYEILKQEREMYEQHFEIEPSTQLWTEFQTKLMAARANNTVKSSNPFAKMVGWKSGILERLRFTPVLTCAALLFIFGISFGLLNFLPSNEVSENALIIKTELRSPHATVANSVETIKDNPQISQEKTEAFKDNSLQIKKRTSGNRFSNERIVFDAKAKKTVLVEVSSAKQAISVRERNLSAKVAQLNKSGQMQQLQEGNSETEVEGDFYSLPFAGIFEDSKEELQILRVEIPRSSLVALGLNPPIENEKGIIKTDLLVSSDGITRAIRLVK
ncbi:MAG: hypothetical protein WKF90_02835 [Pyrinomonadaceae bacterium]